MRRLETTGELDWIPCLHGQDLPAMGGPRVVLANALLPVGFDAYAKLFHPIHEDLGCQDPELHWSDPWDDRYGRGRADESFPARGLKWHDLAEELDIEMDVSMHLADFLVAFPGSSWPRRLVGPEDGELDVDTVHHLMRLLLPHTGDQDCFFYWSSTRSADGRPLLIQSPLSSLLTWHGNPASHGSPVALWPPDRCWLFLTHPELPFSLLACNRELLADLLCDKPLDGIEITLTVPLQHR